MDRIIRYVLNEKNSRVLYPHPISSQIREQLLEAAVGAPTATALQAYSIIVVEDPLQRQSLHQVCQYPSNTESPLLVVFCIDLYRIKHIIIEQEKPEQDFHRDCPNIFMLAICDAVAAAQAMVTTAKRKGLVADYSGTILNNVGCVRKILALPEYVFPIAMLRLGYHLSSIERQPALINPIHINRYVHPEGKETAEYKKYYQYLFESCSELQGDRVAAEGRAMDVWKELTHSGFFRNIREKDGKKTYQRRKSNLEEIHQVIQQAQKISRRRKQYNLKTNLLYGLARFYLIRKQPGRALNCFSKAILLIPDAAELYCCLGATHQHLGNIERSLHYFEKAVSLCKREPYFYLWLGKCQLLRGEGDAALQSLNKALELDPTFLEAWFAKAALLEKEMVWEGALYCYHKIESLKHRDHHLYNNMALAYLGLGKLKEARKYCGKALDLRPKDPIILANIGLIFSKMGEHKKAIACYNRALKAQPDNVDLLNNKGYSLLKMECYQEALAIYELALELKPGLLSALENKASCLTLLGRTKEALHCYNAILRQQPSGPTALNNKALCLIKIGKYKQALDYHQQALKNDPENISFLGNTAACLLKMERYSEALVHYEHALRLYPEEPALLSGKGVCLDYLGRFDEAVNCYNHALRLA